MTIAALHAAMKTMILLSRRIRDSDCGWGGTTKMTHLRNLGMDRR